MSYVLLGTFKDLATFLTPYGQQPWVMCKTRKPFTCVRTNKWWPEGTFAWRPAGNPKNRHERIAVDGLMDARSIACIVRGRPSRVRFVKILAEKDRPMFLSRISHQAGLSSRECHKVLDTLIQDGLVRIVSDVEATADWYRGNGQLHSDCAIAFNDS